MNTTQFIFLILLGLFALIVCVYAAIVLFIRIVYLIGKKKGRWS